MALGLLLGTLISPARAAEPTTLRSLYGLTPPAAIDPARTAVVLVDFQEEFFSGRLALPEGDRAVANAVRLAAWARESGILVVHVRNVAARPSSPVFAPGAPTTAIVSALAPRREDWVVTKSMAGAFSRTDLDARLESRGVHTLILAGLMTHLAVQVTASDATVLGYEVVVAGDAVATRALPDALGGGVVDADMVQRVTLAAMADRVADVLPTEVITRIPARSPAP